MADPLGSARALAEQAKELTETLTRIVDWESVGAAEMFSEAAYTHVESALTRHAADLAQARLDRDAAHAHACEASLEERQLRADLAQAQAWIRAMERREDAAKIELAQAQAETARLREAILWALGENGTFPPEPEPLGGTYRRQYWWRSELRRRAFGD